MDPVSATPKSRSQTDLVGTWYFHTLVCGPSAKWERGTLSIDETGRMIFSEFTDSDHYDPEYDLSTAAVAPADVVITLNSDKTLFLSGADAWDGFHGNMASRKNMLAATRWNGNTATRGSGSRRSSGILPLTPGCPIPGDLWNAVEAKKIFASITWCTCFRLK